MRPTRGSPDEAACLACSVGAAPIRSPPDPLKPHPKVLIVDDDPAIGRMLRVILESERYRVLWSRSGADRSEEHTSELQSLRHLVFRLLLAKNTPSGRLDLS